MFSSASQKDEAGWTGATVSGHTWDQFDALPPGVKRYFWEAPYDYGCIGAYRAMVAGFDLRRIVMRQLKACRRDVQREVRRLYGPQHPQAGAHG